MRDDQQIRSNEREKSAVKKRSDYKNWPPVIIGEIIGGSVNRGGPSVCSACEQRRKGKEWIRDGRSGFLPGRFIGIQRRCRSRKLISKLLHCLPPEELRKVLHPASNWLASSAKFPVKHSNSCLLGWTTIKKPAVGGKLSRWKRTFQNACTLLGSYTPFFLDTLIVCVFPLYIKFDKKKKRYASNRDSAKQITWKLSAVFSRYI